MPEPRSRRHLISAAYQREQEALHEKGYGAKGWRWAETVTEIAQYWGYSSILDYGCGQGSLGRFLRARGWQAADYDPCVQSFSGEPAEASLVVCTDVLEHVEPEKIGAVLAHLRSLTRGHLLTVISRVDAGKTLSDGRNAHILLRDEIWWLRTMRSVRLYPTDYAVPNPNPAKQMVELWQPSEVI